MGSEMCIRDSNGACAERWRHGGSARSAVGVIASEQHRGAATNNTPALIASMQMVSCLLTWTRVVRDGSRRTHSRVWKRREGLPSILRLSSPGLSRTCAHHTRKHAKRAKNGTAGAAVLPASRSTYRRALSYLGPSGPPCVPLTQPLSPAAPECQRTVRRAVADYRVDEAGAVEMYGGTFTGKMNIFGANQASGSEGAVSGIHVLAAVVPDMKWRF